MVRALLEHSLASCGQWMSPVVLVTSPQAAADLTWMRERMLAKWVSMAPPLGKFWLILFMRWLKQL